MVYEARRISPNDGRGSSRFRSTSARGATSNARAGCALCQVGQEGASCGGTRKFNSVATFHAAYLELGGTPRRKSVGKDRLNAGRKIGRKHNRLSWAQRNALWRASVNGTARLAKDDRHDLYPSESVNNRHGLEGQASRAAAALVLPRSSPWTNTGRHKLGPGPPGRSKGGRNYVKVADRIPPPVPAVDI